MEICGLMLWNWPPGTGGQAAWWSTWTPHLPPPLLFQLSKLSVVPCRAQVKALSRYIALYAHGQADITYTIMASAGYCNPSANKDYRVLAAWYIWSKIYLWPLCSYSNIFCILLILLVQLLMNPLHSWLLCWTKVAAVYADMYLLGNERIVNLGCRIASAAWMQVTWYVLCDRENNSGQRHHHTMRWTGDRRRQAKELNYWWIWNHIIDRS